MTLIDPKTINDAPQLKNIAETYRLALEAMTARAGEMEFNYLDHKRAYDALMINAMEFQLQIDTLKRRVLELEEGCAPVDSVCKTTDAELVTDPRVIVPDLVVGHPYPSDDEGRD